MISDSFLKRWDVERNRRVEEGQRQAKCYVLDAARVVNHDDDIFSRITVQKK